MSPHREQHILPSEQSSSESQGSPPLLEELDDELELLDEDELELLLDELELLDEDELLLELELELLDDELELELDEELLDELELLDDEQEGAGSQDGGVYSLQTSITTFSSASQHSSNGFTIFVEQSLLLQPLQQFPSLSLSSPHLQGS